MKNLRVQGDLTDLQLKKSLFSKKTDTVGNIRKRNFDYEAKFAELLQVEDLPLRNFMIHEQIRYYWLTN